MDATIAYRPIFEIEMPLRWADMDALGHVNNTMYFRYMEQTRVSWIESLAVRERGQGIAIVKASMEFLKALYYPGDVVGLMSVGRPGRSSFDTTFELRRADDPATLYARGSALCVWIDVALGKSTPLPDALRAVIESGPLARGRG